jgi:hypothetical protein
MILHGGGKQERRLNLHSFERVRGNLDAAPGLLGRRGVRK